MEYLTYTPPVPLRPFVRYYWSLEGKLENGAIKKFRTIADGCPGFIYQQAGSGQFFQDGKPLSPVFLFGQSTRHAILSLSGGFKTMGINFYPHAIKNVFGLNAEELTDSCLDAGHLEKGVQFSLADRLDSANSVAQKTEIFSNYLVLQINKYGNRADGVMQYALEKILESKGSILLKELRRELQLTERSFERRFKQYVGISPKLFSRICNFQAALKQLRNKEYNKLSDIAFENNYSDQSHFIRSFKEFAGYSPRIYQKQSSEVVENLAELVA